MRFFQLFIIIGIVLLYLFKQVLLVEFSFDAYSYVIVLLSILALISAFQFKGGVPIVVFFYFLIFHLSVLAFFFTSGTIGPGYYEGYFVYFFQPFVLWLFLRKGTIDADLTLGIIANTVFISIAGAILYYINIFFPLDFFKEIFKLEFTSIGSSVVIRNTSVYGNSLVAAGIGLIQMCSSAILVYLGKKRHVITLILSFLFIATTLSRRSIVAGFVVLFLLFIMSPKSIQKKMLNMGTLFLPFLFIYAWEYVIVFFDRFVSSVDFSESNASNTSRINAIIAGIVIIFTDLTGTGMGSLSSLGKDVENIHNSENFIGVTESMYITFIGEIGILFSIPIFILYYYSIKSKTKATRWLLVFPFLVESIMGLGMLNPAVNFMFFLAYFSCMRVEGHGSYTLPKSNSNCLDGDPDQDTLSHVKIEVHKSLIKVR